MSRKGTENTMKTKAATTTPSKSLKKNMVAAMMSLGATFGAVGAVGATAAVVLPTQKAHAAETSIAPEIRLTPEDAVARALQANLELGYERLNPALSHAPTSLAESQFDPTVYGAATVSGSPGSVSASRAGLSPVSTTSATFEGGIKKTFSTGTSIDIGLRSSGLFGSSGSLNPAYQTGLSMDVRQNLLRGFSRDANEIAIINAKLGRTAAGERLDRKSEVVATDVLRSYWDLHAAIANVQVAKIALETSKRTLAETESLISVGKQAAAEALVAKYQVQQQQRLVIGAEQARDNAKDRLARLIGLVDARSLATPNIVPIGTPETVLPATDTTELQKLALENRGDFKALKTDITSKKAEANATDHLLLPKLDLVGSIGLTGLAGTTAGGGLASVPNGYFSSYGMDRMGWSVGLVLEIPLGNRAAEARRDLANLEVKRADSQLERATQQISEDLNVAWRAAKTMREQLELTRAAADVAATKLKNEMERYRNGKTTAQAVTLMQSDLVKEQLAKEQALADFNKALVDLRATTGTLVAMKSSTQKAS